jgi:hypothetical protein
MANPLGLTGGGGVVGGGASDVVVVEGGIVVVDVEGASDVLVVELVELVAGDVGSTISVRAESKVAVSPEQAQIMTMPASNSPRRRGGTTVMESGVVIVRQGRPCRVPGESRVPIDHRDESRNLRL